MLNYAMLIFLLTHTEAEAIHYATSKNSRILPDNKSALVKTLINSKGKKKKDIFTETGLSADFMYKVLRGSKRLQERDYLISFCLAATLDLYDSFLLLHLYQCALFDSTNPRDCLLMECITQQYGFEKTNKILKACGLQTLRTSPKQEKIVITHYSETHQISIQNDYNPLKNIGTASYNNLTYSILNGTEKLSCQTTQGYFYTDTIFGLPTEYILCALNLKYHLITVFQDKLQKYSPLQDENIIYYKQTDIAFAEYYVAPNYYYVISYPHAVFLYLKCFTSLYLYLSFLFKTGTDAVFYQLFQRHNIQIEYIIGDLEIVEETEDYMRFKTTKQKLNAWQTDI